MKAEFEAYVVVIRHRHGKRVAERKPLHVPLDVATANFERLSDLQLRELANDLKFEAWRRSNAAARQQEIKTQTGGYDPAASQITRRSA